MANLTKPNLTKSGRPKLRPGPIPKKGANWVWTRAKEQAAWLIAEDKMTDVLKAEACGISKVTLYNWKQQPEFQERVKKNLEIYASIVRQRSIALLDRRLDTYIDDFDATTTILKERGTGPDGKPMPPKRGAEGGLGTGFIAKDFKGKDADQAVYSFDAALMRERRALREQVAKELGQWSDKKEVTGAGGGPISIVLSPADQKL